MITKPTYSTWAQVQAERQLAKIGRTDRVARNIFRLARSIKLYPERKWSWEEERLELADRRPDMEVLLGILLLLPLSGLLWGLIYSTNWHPQGGI